jgi:cytochrome d ubiquinol oxidase subunit I
MEGLFETRAGAPVVIMGQPDVERKRIDNPIVFNRVLSMLIYGRPNAEVKGLDAFPRENWPTNIPLLFFSYHVMAGLGTLFIATMGLAALLLWRGLLWRSRWMLWTLMLAVPFPFIANIAGWMTAELGRQPWLVYGLLRTENGHSANVSAGNTLFTLLGYMGLYAVLSMLLLLILQSILSRGPEAAQAHEGGH